MLILYLYCYYYYILLLLFCFFVAVLVAHAELADAILALGVELHGMVHRPQGPTSLGHIMLRRAPEDGLPIYLY